MKFGELFSLVNSLAFGGIFFNIIGAHPYAHVACIAFPVSLVVVPTLVFLFLFMHTYILFFLKENKYTLAWSG